MSAAICNDRNIYIYEHEAIRIPKSENNIGAPSAPQQRTPTQACTYMQSLSTHATHAHNTHAHITSVQTHIHARTHARTPRHSHRTATNKHAHKNRRSFTTVFDDSSSRLPYARVLTSKRAIPPFYGKHVLLATVLALARDEHSPTFTVQATVHARAWYTGLPPLWRCRNPRARLLLRHYAFCGTILTDRKIENGTIQSRLQYSIFNYD